MAGVMKHTMVVRHPDTLAAEALLAGEPVPDWVTDDLVHPDNTQTKAQYEAAQKGDSTSDAGGGSGSGHEDKGYAGQTPDELKAEAEKRDLTVEGTGANGNVLKGDLVAALEADDATKAGA